jgi:hypothetical protein
VELFQDWSEEDGEGMADSIDQNHAENARPDDFPSVKDTGLSAPRWFSEATHFMFPCMWETLWHPREAIGVCVSGAARRSGRRPGWGVLHARGGVSSAPEVTVKGKDG